MIKPKLYLLPGTMCDATLWRHVAPSLEAQFELNFIAIPKETNLQAMVASLAAQLPDTKVNLAGFSLGGYLSALFTQSVPQRVERLMVVANSPCALPESELVQRRQTIAFLQKFEYRGATPMRINQLLGERSKDDSALIEHILQMEIAVGLDQLLPQLQATSERDDLSQFFAQTEVETKFVYGDEDVLVNAQWIESLANPYVSRKRLEQVGHMSPLEAPTLLAAEMLSFFNRN